MARLVRPPRTTPEPASNASSKPRRSTREPAISKPLPADDTALPSKGARGRNTVEDRRNRAEQNIVQQWGPSWKRDLGAGDESISVRMLEYIASMSKNYSLKESTPEIEKSVRSRPPTIKDIRKAHERLSQVGQGSHRPAKRKATEYLDGLPKPKRTQRGFSSAVSSDSHGVSSPSQDEEGEEEGVDEEEGDKEFEEEEENENEDEDEDEDEDEEGRAKETGGEEGKEEEEDDGEDDEDEEGVPSTESPKRSGRRLAEGRLSSINEESIADASPEIEHGRQQRSSLPNEPSDVISGFGDNTFGFHSGEEPSNCEQGIPDLAIPDQPLPKNKQAIEKVRVLPTFDGHYDDPRVTNSTFGDSINGKSPKIYSPSDLHVDVARMTQSLQAIAAQLDQAKQQSKLDLIEASRRGKGSENEHKNLLERSEERFGSFIEAKTDLWIAKKHYDEAQEFKANHLDELLRKPGGVAFAESIAGPCEAVLTNLKAKLEQMQSARRLSLDNTFSWILAVVVGRAEMRRQRRQILRIEQAQKAWTSEVNQQLAPVSDLLQEVMNGRETLSS